ncbi:MAG: hypothetical protein ACE5JR_01160 [Gemmatimonadota bacterium]
MRRTVPILAAALALSAAPAFPQEASERSPSIVYESYFQVPSSQMPAWREIYYRHVAPVLGELREEGTIQGWAALTHVYGDNYNWRSALRFYEWSDIEAGFGAFFERMRARMSDEEWEEWGKLGVGHRDEIWSVGPNTPPREEFAYLQTGLFQVAAGRMGEWNELFDGVAAPALNEAVENGTLGGWVVLRHHTGGKHNWKILYFFKDWDSIDDFFEGFVERLQESGAMTQFGDMIRSHRDYIWEPVPTEPAEG